MHECTHGLRQSGGARVEGSSAPVTERCWTWRAASRDLYSPKSISRVKIDASASWTEAVRVVALIRSLPWCSRCSEFTNPVAYVVASVFAS